MRRVRHTRPLRAVLGCERLEDRETPAAAALDPTFSSDGRLQDARVRGDLRAVAVQADGKVVAAGSTLVSGGTAAVVARYNADGTPDRTFDGDGLVVLDFGRHRGSAAAVAVQADGKVVIAGSDGGDGLHVARFNVNGSLDRTFDGDGQAFTSFGGLGVSATALAVQADGKLVVAGTWSPGGGTPDRTVLARYNRDGSADRTLDGDGKLATAWGTTGVSAGAVAVQRDGKLVVAGTATSASVAAVTLL